jgi:serine/threonine-protein kinase
VLAGPDSPWYRLSKGLARNRLAVAAAASVLAAVLSGTVLAAWQAHVAFTEKAHAEEVRDFLVTLFRDASPYGSRGRALSAPDWLQHVKTRVDDRLRNRPALRVELLNIVGSNLLTLQDTAGADEVLTEALEEATRRLGPDHPQTIRARVLMTPVHRFRGRTREMRADLERLMPVLRANRRAFAEDLVVALRNQAHLEIDEGRYAAAERAAQEAVDAGRETLGEEHPETVAALLMRAYAYQFSRSPDTALMTSARAYLAAVAAHRESPRHPRVIEGRLLYGRALGEAGETARGVRYLSRAVSDAAEVFGPSSRMVGFFSLPLAKFQLEAGEIAGAIEHSRRAADIIARHTRPESFRYATAIHHRGAALLAARRADEALPDLTAAATTLQAVLPPGHEITRAFQADQALALARAGRHHQARAFLEPLLPGPGSPVDRSGARLLYALGVASRLSGEFEAAVRVQRQALQSLARLPAVEPERMRVLTETGLALLDLGRHDEAAAPLEQALALSRQVQTQLAPDRADILVGLGRAYMAGGRSAEAHELLVTASRFWQAFDADNRETASVARWLHPLKNLVRHNSQGTRHKEG